MILEGKIRKHKKWWLIEIPVLDLLTQAKSKKEAYFMLGNALELLLNDKGLRIKIIPHSKNTFFLSSNNPISLLSLMLKRQRALKNISLSEMAKKLKTKSKNAYAQYEQGRSEPSLSKLQEFISVLAPQQDIEIRLVSTR